eukprot:5684812-Pleurochrysis_carterae.AAC.1
MMAIVSLSRARAARTISAASASVSSTTSDAAERTGPKTRTLRQTVNSSNAAMGMRGSHHTVRSGTRHHRPVPRALECRVASHYPCERRLWARHPAESRIGGRARSVEQRVQPALEPVAHGGVADDGGVRSVADLLVRLQGPEQAAHAVRAAPHHEEEALQKED